MLKGRIAPVLSVCLLVALVVVVYHSATKNSFHLDDWTSIQVRPSVQMEEFSLENLRTAWDEGFLPGRPLANLSFAIDWWRGEGGASTFQATNVGIHAVSAVVVFCLLYLVLMQGAGADPFRASIAACFGAALWAAHPIQVQAVTYIVQRMASMSSLFVVLAVAAYVRARISGRIGWYFLCGASFLLAIAVKESAWITPALLLLAEYGVCRHDGKLVRRRIDAVMLALPVVVMAVVSLDLLVGFSPLSERVFGGYVVREFTPTERLLTQPRVIGFHFSQILWPLPSRFSIEHDFPFSVNLWTPVSTLLAWTAAGLWSASGLWLFFRRGKRLLGFALLWVPATLAIESSVIGLEMVFEHRMYLATVGLAVLAAVGIDRGLRGGKAGKVVTIVVSLVLVALFSASTMARLPVWRTDRTLYEHAVRHAPGKARVWSNLGRLQLRAGERDLAEDSLRRALDLDPYDVVALEDLGVVLLDRREFHEALGLLERARAAALPDYSVLNHLGEAYLAVGRNPEAKEMFGKAASLVPTAPNPRWNLAVAHERLGECAEARLEWEAYLQLEPLETEKARVREHLVENYATPGGKCFDARTGPGTSGR